MQSAATHDYKVGTSSALWARAEMLQIFVESLHGWASSAWYPGLEGNGGWRKTNRIWMGFSNRCINVIHFQHWMPCIMPRHATMLQATCSSMEFIYCEKFLLFAYSHILVRIWVRVCVCVCVQMHSRVCFPFLHFNSISLLLFFNSNWLNSFQKSHLVALMCKHADEIRALSRVVVHALVWFYASFAS